MRGGRQEYQGVGRNIKELEISEEHLAVGQGDQKVSVQDRMVDFGVWKCLQQLCESDTFQGVKELEKMQLIADCADAFPSFVILFLQVGADGHPTDGLEAGEPEHD